jgi:hypothetical protein
MPFAGILRSLPARTRSAQSNAPKSPHARRAAQLRFAADVALATLGATQLKPATFANMKALLYLLIMASFFSTLFGCKPRKAYETAEIYMSLRQQIFDLPKTNSDFGQSDRWAILMETGLADACYTLVAVADGSASLYFSNGGGIIGGGEHPEGAAAAKANEDSFVVVQGHADHHIIGPFQAILERLVQ